MFWKGIADVGLMEEVVCNIQKEMEELLRGVQQRLIQAPFQVTGESTQSGINQHFKYSQVASQLQRQRHRTFILQIRKVRLGEVKALSFTVHHCALFMGS